MNTVRNENGKTVANRRIYYDFTMSPPKSVSVVALYQDARIIKLHDEAVRKAMVELETYAAGRIRKSKRDEDRATGNVIGAAYRHDTSRELDPHLHTHYTFFTGTYDPVEECWKALQVGDMFRARKFVENVYYHELTKGLAALGYEVEQTAKGPEIRGVPISVRKLFSKRQAQINQETEKAIEKNGVPTNVGDLRKQIRSREFIDERCLTSVDNRYTHTSEQFDLLGQFIHSDSSIAPGVVEAAGVQGARRFFVWARRALPPYNEDEVGVSCGSHDCFATVRFSRGAALQQPARRDEGRISVFVYRACRTLRKSSGGLKIRWTWQAQRPLKGLHRLISFGCELGFSVRDGNNK